jgi:hypothetical protein
MLEFANWKQQAYIIGVVVLGLSAFLYGLFSTVQKAGRFKRTK